MRDCGVVWFICVVEAALWFPMSHLTMEKVQLSPHRGQDKSQCPEFLLHIKVQSSPASS